MVVGAASGRRTTARTSGDVPTSARITYGPTNPDAPVITTGTGLRPAQLQVSVTFSVAVVRAATVTGLVCGVQPRFFARTV